MVKTEISLNVGLSVGHTAVRRNSEGREDNRARPSMRGRELNTAQNCMNRHKHV
jgi:hypothetical protein